MYMSVRMFSNCTRAIVRLQQTYVYMNQYAGTGVTPAIKSHQDLQ